MKPFDVFDAVFFNLSLFLSMTLCFVGILYFSVRKVALAGYFDPIHFVWTFTYGTAYALVAGLYMLEYVSDYYFALVMLSGIFFILSFRFFISIQSYNLTRFLVRFLKPSVGFRSIFLIVSILYLAAIIYQISIVGFGMLATTNRFEQARGNGAVIRFLSAITPFMVAGISIYLYNLKKKCGVGFKFLIMCLLLVVFIAFNSVLDGSKMAILTYIYSAFLGLVLYTHKKPRFYPVRLFILFLVILSFALLVQSVDLKNQNLDSSRAVYLSEQMFPIERLIFRIIGNGDQYYLGLPNGVVDKIEIDSVYIRLLAPFVGSTNLSNNLGYNVNDYNVGRQITLFHSPGRVIAGGATSHFDLFAYKYFGLYFSWLWILIIAFILSVLIKINRFSFGNVFVASLGAQLWGSSLSILIEPPIGIAKIFDVFIIFFAVKFFVVVTSGVMRRQNDCLGAH